MAFVCLSSFPRILLDFFFFFFACAPVTFYWKILKLDMFLLLLLSFWGDINKLLISRMRSLFKVWSTLHFIPAGLLLSSPWPCCSQDNGGSYALIGWVTVTFSLTRAFNEECSLSLARPVRNIDLIFVHFSGNRGLFIKIIYEGDWSITSTVSLNIFLFFLIFWCWYVMLVWNSYTDNRLWKLYRVWKCFIEVICLFSSWNLQKTS